MPPTPGASPATSSGWATSHPADSPIADRPSRLPEQPEPPAEELPGGRRELAAAPGVGGLLQHLALGGVGVDDRGDAAEPDALGDRQAELAEHVAGVLRHQGGAEDRVAATPQVDAQEALLLAVENGAIVIGDRHGQRVHLEAAGAGVPPVEADAGDLGARVADPWH